MCENFLEIYPQHYANFWEMYISSCDVQIKKNNISKFYKYIDILGRVCDGNKFNLCTLSRNIVRRKSIGSIFAIYARMRRDTY